MVRYAEGDEILLKYLSNVANDFKCAIGLILGQISSQRFNVIHFAKTPPFQSEADKREDKPLKNIKNISELNDDWITDHAKQTTRMLPGGMHVLGLFVVCEEDVLSPFDRKIKSILNVIHKTLQGQNYLCGSGDNEKLLLHFNPKSHKYLAKTCDVTTSNVQPAEFKFLQKCSRFVSFDYTYQIDHVHHLKKNESVGPLRKHLKIILDGINKNLQSGIILFENDLKDLDEKIENMSKKKKVPRGSSNKIFQEANEIKPVTVSIFEKCIFPTTPSKIEHTTTGGEVRIIGEVACKVWLNSKSTFGEAVQAVKDDIMRSLATRMEMHWDSLIEEELGEDANSVHEPPRRVLITLPESSVTISDYLFPGEGPEDAKASLEELLDIKTESHLDLLDLEGQADITQYYKESTAAESESEDYLPKITDSSKFMYLMGLAAAVLILIISIIAHFYLKG